MAMRRSLFQHILRIFPAEVAHNIRLGMLRFVGALPLGKWYLRRTLAPRTNSLEREVMGIHFQNPIGIAAGFDPNGDHLTELASTGFGFVEIGSVTPRPQPGTPRPRLSRIRKRNSLLNNSGAPNLGLEYVMRNVRRRNKFTRNLVIGCNIGKLTTTPPKNIVKEYLRVFRNMYQYVDFFVVNLSCNTASKQFVPRTREEILSLIEPMFEFRRGQLDYRPILVKISPDMTQEELDMVVSILIETPLDGIEAVSGSTALANEERGAVCGAMLTECALEVVRYVAQRSEYNYPIIGSGGMMTPEDIERMFEAGASLVALSSGVRENGLKLLRRTTKLIASKNLTTRR
jgi:dihydroorotate dehydrogenase